MIAARLHRHLARLVLAWFVAFVAVAGAAPMVDPQPLGAICTSSSPAGSHDSGTLGGAHVLQCALCAGLAAPPPQIATAAAPPDGVAHAVQPIPAARIAALTRAPLPARGPPLLA